MRIGDDGDARMGGRHTVKVPSARFKRDSFAFVSATYGKKKRIGVSLNPGSLANMIEIRLFNQACHKKTTLRTKWNRCRRTADTGSPD